MFRKRNCHSRFSCVTQSNLRLQFVSSRTGFYFWMTKSSSRKWIWMTAPKLHEIQCMGNIAIPILRYHWCRYDKTTRGWLHSVSWHKSAHNFLIHWQQENVVESVWNRGLSRRHRHSRQPISGQTLYCGLMSGLDESNQVFLPRSLRCFFIIPVVLFVEKQVFQNCSVIISWKLYPSTHTGDSGTNLSTQNRFRVRESSYSCSMILKQRKHTKTKQLLLLKSSELLGCKEKLF